MERTLQPASNSYRDVNLCSEDSVANTLCTARKSRLLTADSQRTTEGHICGLHPNRDARCARMLPPVHVSIEHITFRTLAKDVTQSIQSSAKLHQHVVQPQDFVGTAPNSLAQRRVIRDQVCDICWRLRQPGVVRLIGSLRLSHRALDDCSPAVHVYARF